jgi:enterochelin esterase-like enzyme
MIRSVLWIMVLTLTILSLAACQPIQPPAPVVATAENAMPEVAVTLAPAAVAPPRVTNESFTIESEALAGNLFGDPTERLVHVLLPLDFAESDKRYPVLYLLPRIYGDAEATAADFGMQFNTMLRGGESPDLIVVVPDTANAFEMSLLRSSPVLGDYEGYLTKEVIDYIDSHYRTLAERESRGIAGCSGGGTASMRLALRRPDLFGAIASAGGEYDASLGAWPGNVEWVKSMTRLPRALGDWDPLGSMNWYYYAAAEAAPNMSNPPFYADAPVRIVDGHGEFVPEVVERITANDSVHAAQQYAAQTFRLNGILILQGRDDDPLLLPPAESFVRHLNELGIDHDFRQVEGGQCPGHWGQIFLKFMDEKLAKEQP